MPGMNQKTFALDSAISWTPASGIPWRRSQIGLGKPVLFVISFLVLGQDDVPIDVVEVHPASL
jgi:hypothetical protein